MLPHILEKWYYFEKYEFQWLYNVQKYEYLVNVYDYNWMNTLCVTFIDIKWITYLHFWLITAHFNLFGCLFNISIHNSQMKFEHYSLEDDWYYRVLTVSFIISCCMRYTMWLILLFYQLSKYIQMSHYLCSSSNGYPSHHHEYICALNRWE